MIIPTEEVTIPGMMSTYVCQSINTGNIQQFQWLLNGTRLEDLNKTDRIRTVNLDQIIGIIHFNNITVDYDNTTIQCKVTLPSGVVISSSNAKLLVQGES